MNFLDLVNKRFSVRSFSNKAVEPEKLNYILECARLAPSACNLQPWRIYVVQSPSLVKSLCLAYDKEWLKSASILLVICGDHNQSWHRPSDGKDHCDIDVAILTEHISLAAISVGLGSCWICNFDTAICREVLGLASNIEPTVIVPLGYSDSSLPFKSKVRKNKEEVFFYK